MAHGDALLLKLDLHVGSHDACLDASHHILFVDILDLVHSGHVERDDHTTFLRVEKKSLSHVSASTVRHDDDVVLVGKLNDGLKD